MKNFNDIEHIKNYLDGRLSGADLKEFESQMSSNEELKKEVEKYETLFKGLQYLNDESFEYEVKNWGTELQNQPNIKAISSKKGRIRSLTRQLAIAASILILLAVGMNYWVNQNYTNQALADNFYSAPLSSGTMGQKDTIVKPLNDLFEKAHQEFQSGEYDRSMSSFNSVMVILATSKNQMDPLAWQFFAENTDWTKVIIMLKSNRENSVEFENLLNSIAENPNHSYSKNAQRLKGELNGFWRKLIK